ncbi:hypothetical protein NDU88_006718 [Pleurodeles waltl]|uniref:Uncharacterized protein n=1 Tax=Pleurodeles waltl TaxID=8319 RepID=A0AAV7PKH4_PLEWA|nr:hypothetical protein NDU88_006718 [Pleurodeles waltl]
MGISLMVPYGVWDGGTSTGVSNYSQLQRPCTWYQCTRHHLAFCLLVQPSGVPLVWLPHSAMPNVNPQEPPQSGQARARPSLRTCREVTGVLLGEQPLFNALIGDLHRHQSMNIEEKNVSVIRPERRSTEKSFESPMPDLGSYTFPRYVAIQRSAVAKEASN